MEQPSPPTSLPKYLAEGLPKQDTETLHEIDRQDMYGPYLYRYYRENGTMKSEYIEKPGSG